MVDYAIKQTYTIQRAAGTLTRERKVSRLTDHRVLGVK